MRNSFNPGSNRRYAAFLAGVSSLVMMPAIAHAQSTTEGEAAPGAAADQSAAEQPSSAAPTAGEEAGAIVVTGSRIIRDGYTAPTPVTVATTEELVKATPTNIPDAINKLPQFANSFSPTRSSHNWPNTANHGNILNLRGIGPLRTLNLFDGVRLPPTTYLGMVDVNVIPNLLVQRVDIVTGGASAAYGSDAVSGVVNFILDRKFTGVRGVVQGGIDQHGDNENYRIGAAGGFGFAGGAGHVLLSGEMFESKGMLKRDRKVFLKGWTHLGSNAGCVLQPGDAATACNPGGDRNPYGLFSNVTIRNQVDRGVILDGPFAGFKFIPGGVTPQDPGQATGTPNFMVGGDGSPIPFAVTAAAPLKTYNAFGRVSYDVAPDVNVFAQGIFSRSEVSYLSLANSFVGGTPAPIFSGNPFIPATVQAAMGPNDMFRMNHYNTSGPKPSTEERTDFWMATAGVEGEIANNWRWNAYYSHGDSRHRAAQSGQYHWARTYAALDAVRDPATGQTVCRVLLDPDPAIRAQYTGCQPLNLMSGESPHIATPEGYAYATGTSRYRAAIKQDMVAASLSGSLFDLPAGPVEVAVGAEYRKQRLKLTTNADPALLDSPAEKAAHFAGLRGVAPSALHFWLTNIGTADGNVRVKEAFGEVSIPVLKDLPIVNSLELNGAGRITNYSTSGTVKTWKLGVIYKPVRDLLLRGNLSRDIRAPSLFELFAGQQFNIGTTFDPVTGRQENIPQVLGGNPDLKPEVAKTLTLGGVFSPSFLPGFNFSVDYYRIKLTGAIGSLNSTQILRNCFEIGPSAPECALITRPAPDEFPTQIRIFPSNIAFLNTSGLDFDASYRTRLGGGDLGVRVYATHLLKYKTQQYIGAPVLDFRGIAVTTSVPEGRPKWRGTLNVNYEIGRFGIFVTEQYIGPMTRAIPGAPSNFLDPSLPAVWYTDLTLSYKPKLFAAETELFVTVNNLFDRDAPISPSTVPGSNPPTLFPVYDVIGRQFTAGLRFRF